MATCDCEAAADADWMAAMDSKARAACDTDATAAADWRAAADCACAAAWVWRTAWAKMCPVSWEWSWVTTLELVAVLVVPDNRSHHALAGDAKKRTRSPARDAPEILPIIVLMESTSLSS